MSRAVNNIFRQMENRTPKEYKRGDIYYIERGGQVVGSEQAAGRPAVIVSNDTGNKHSDDVTVVYLTTQPKKDLPTHVYICSSQKVSIALCETISTVSKQRIGGYYGTATAGEMRQVDEALAVALALKEPEAAGEPVDVEKLKEQITGEVTAGFEQRIEELQGQQAAAIREKDFYKSLYEDMSEKNRRLVIGGGYDVLTIMGTVEETDNIVEMMALAGACDICPGAHECKQHKEEPENTGSAWEKLSCGEVIRKNVNIIAKGAGKC